MSRAVRRSMPASRAAQRGFSLVELMVAAVLGLFLVGGALAIHVHSHGSYRVTEAMARLQENARVALDLIMPELRMAGYWVLTDAPAGITGRLGGPGELSAAFAPAGDCYAGSYINLSLRIEAANDDQLGAANPFAACIPDALRAPGTDIVLIRRAASNPTPAGALVNGRLYLRSNRLAGALFVGGQPLPAGFAATDPIHEVLTYAFYVNPSSSVDDALPSLHRVRLGDGPTIIDEELVPGIEDLQVQLGIDADGDGSVESYFSPGNPALAGAEVTSARLWVRVRADRSEVGFTDGAEYRYANVSIEPQDGLRRTLMSTTVHLRNGRELL